MSRDADYADSNAPGCLAVVCFIAGMTLVAMTLAWVFG